MAEQSYNIDISDEISHRKISEKEKQELRTKGKTDEKLKDFYSDQKKEKFDAFLVVKNNKIQFDQIEYHNDRNKAVEKETKEESYQVPKKVFGVKLTEEQRQVLSKPNQETELIKGFKKRDPDSGTTMEFDAHLSISKDKNERYNLNFKYYELEKKVEKTKENTLKDQIEKPKKVTKSKGIDL